MFAQYDVVHTRLGKHLDRSVGGLALSSLGRLVGKLTATFQKFCSDSAAQTACFCSVQLAEAEIRLGPIRQLFA